MNDDFGFIFWYYSSDGCSQWTTCVKFMVKFSHCVVALCQVIISNFNIVEGEQAHTEGGGKKGCDFFVCVYL